MLPHGKLKAIIINQRDIAHTVHKVHEEAGARSTTVQLNSRYSDRLLYCELNKTKSVLKVHLSGNQLLHG
jgi:hypothetical protein